MQNRSSVANKWAFRSAHIADAISYKMSVRILNQFHLDTRTVVANWKIIRLGLAKKSNLKS